MQAPSEICKNDRKTQRPITSLDSTPWTHHKSGLTKSLIEPTRLFPATGGDASEQGHCPEARSRTRWHFQVRYRSATKRLPAPRRRLRCAQIAAYRRITLRFRKHRRRDRPDFVPANSGSALAEPVNAPGFAKNLLNILNASLVPPCQMCKISTISSVERVERYTTT